MNLVAAHGQLLVLLLGLPLIGALSLFFVDANNHKGARNIAVLTSFATFLLSLLLLQEYNPLDTRMQFGMFRPWIPNFGISIALGVDGLSVWMIVLTTLLTLLVMLASQSVEKKLRAYLGLMLLLECGMVGTFMALDGVVFYLFWELMLIPMYFLIGVWGGARRIYAALKFVLYTAFGSLLMLVAIAYLGYMHAEQFGHWSFLLSDWTRLRFAHNEELVLFSAFAIAFAIKIPIFPFHTWLPDAHVEAPTGGSVILAGVMLKMGLYGLIRFGVPVFPEAVIAAQPIFATLGVIGIVFGALVAWVQADMKKLVAYSSVSHLGFCVLGFASMTEEGIQGCILQMINHGISTGALFLLVGVVYDRKHTRLIADYQGLAAKVPMYATVFMIFMLSSIGLPLTNGFVGEFLILLGGFRYQPILGAIAVSGVVLGAVYMLSLYRRIIFGALNSDKNGDLDDLYPSEQLVFAPLLVLVFLVGLYPGPILHGVRGTTKMVLQEIETVTAVRVLQRELGERPGVAKHT